MPANINRPSNSTFRTDRITADYHGNPDTKLGKVRIVEFSPDIPSESTSRGLSFIEQTLSRKVRTRGPAAPFSRFTTAVNLDFTAAVNSAATADVRWPSSGNLADLGRDLVARGQTRNRSMSESNLARYFGAQWRQTAASHQ